MGGQGALSQKNVCGRRARYADDHPVNGDDGRCLAELLVKSTGLWNRICQVRQHDEDDVRFWDEQATNLCPERRVLHPIEEAHEISEQTSRLVRGSKKAGKERRLAEEAEHVAVDHARVGSNVWLLRVRPDHPAGSEEDGQIEMTEQVLRAGWTTWRDDAGTRQQG